MSNFEREFNKNREIKSEFGNNVVIHAVFNRHGEKELDPEKFETDLTKKGERQAEDFGLTRNNKDMIKAYSSDTPRTLKTGKIITESSPISKKGFLRKSQELSFTYDPLGQLNHDMQAMKKASLRENFENLSLEEKEKNMEEIAEKLTDYYLSFGDIRPDPKTFSPTEIASQTAVLIDKYIKMAGKLKNNSKVDLINSTHDLNLASFLKEVMIREKNGEKILGFEKIEEIGGVINFLENFEIIINKINKDKTDLKMLFRGKEYEIDKQRFVELLEIAKKIK